ncbi:MAG: proton-conducting transporter membrane subunit, partial [Terriglobia bacterium]
HMGFVTMGIFSMTHQGIEGGNYQMLSHGVVSGALFLCVGVIYDRMHTREIAAYGWLVARMPVYAACLMVFALANVGLPGTGGFVGEFLTMLGTFRVNTWVVIFAATGAILSAVYMLYLYWRVAFGQARTAEAAAMKDLDVREWWLLAPIALAVFWMGIYPESFLRPIRNDVGRVLIRLNSVAPSGDSHLALSKGASMKMGAMH